MGARNERIAETRKNNKAEIAAARGDGEYVSEEEAEARSRIEELEEELEAASNTSSPRTTGETAERVRGLGSDMRKVRTGLKKFVVANKGLWMKQAKHNKAQQAQIDKLIDIVSEIQADEQNLHREAVAARGDAAALFGQLAPLIRVGVVAINSGDVVRYPAALAMAEAIDAFSLETPGGKGMQELLVAILKAWAYYDPSVGLSSMFQADSASTPSTPGNVAA